MNIYNIRNSALSNIDESNGQPLWRGQSWPGGSSSSSNGVSGIGISGNYISGLISLLSDGNITLIQSANNITISGSSNSSYIGSYVSGLGVNNNYLTGAINLISTGSVQLIQDGQNIIISGVNQTGYSANNSGVNNIIVSGNYLTGNVEIIGIGNVVLSRQNNQIFISGINNSGSSISNGGVTGIGVSGNYLTGGINLKSEGSIVLTQSGQDIIIGGGGGTSQSGQTIIVTTGDGIYISLRNTGGQELNSGVFNAINWSSGIRSGVLTFDQSEPSKIYITSGCSGYYSISANVNINNNDLFDNYVWKKNGNTYLTNKSANSVNTYLNDGDYIEYYINPVNSTSISGDINCDIVNILGGGGNGGSNLPTSGTGYLYNDGSGNLSWDNALGIYIPAPIRNYPLSSDFNDIITGDSMTGLNISTISSGQYSGWTQFNAGYLTLPTGDYLNNLNEYTFSIEVIQTNTASWQRIFDIGNGQQNYIALSLLNSNNNCFIENMLSGISIRNNNSSLRTSNSLETNSLWPINHHNYIIITKDKTTNTVKVYINGMYYVGITGVKGFSHFQNLSSPYIGKSQYINDSNFYGYMRNFKIFDKCLTPLQVMGLCN